MNILKISKTTLLAAAIIGSPALFADSAVSRSETSTSYEQSQSTTQIERETKPNSNAGAGDQGINSTAQGGAYSGSRETDADQEKKALSAEAGRHVQMLVFDVDSVMLNDSSQEKLDTLAGALDKDTPAKVTVQVESQSTRFDGTGSAAASADTEASSADTLASRETNQAAEPQPSQEDAAADLLSQEMQENARLISEHRAERVKQFLEDRGIEVAAVTVENNDQQEVAADTGAAQEDVDGAQASAENVQEVLIVISERRDAPGVSLR